jgi:hypothetical protein
MCFPNGTSSRLISTAYFSGRTAVSAAVVCSGVAVATYPQRWVMRWTWISTAMRGWPQAMPRTRLAHLMPTPWKASRTSASQGKRPWRLAIAVGDLYTEGSRGDAQRGCDVKTLEQHDQMEQAITRRKASGGKLNTSGDDCVRSAMDKEPVSPSVEERVARSLEVMGKYAWVSTSSEEFSRRKQEEIAHEDGRP